MLMFGRDVLVEHHAGLAVVTLNRPNALNAINEAMARELPAVLANLIEDDAVRAILLTGSGRAFCAGSDLREAARRDQNSARGGDALRFLFNPMIADMVAAPKPIVAAVNGPAVGFGCALALAADIVLAGRSAIFSQAFVNLGAVPDAGSTWLLPKIIGEARARAMMLLGESIDANLALAWGMVHRVVDDEKLRDVAFTAASALASGPTIAIAQIKKLISLGATSSLTEQLSAEAAAQDTAFSTSDFAEGIAAFIAKRVPDFRAR